MSGATKDSSEIQPSRHPKPPLNKVHVVFDLPDEDRIPKPPQTRHPPTTSNISSAQNFQYDETILHNAIRDAGRWAFGTVLVEMWVMSEDRTCLFRPDSAWWVDPVYHRNCHDGCQICRLIDRRRHDFVAPSPLVPGEGLPGVLWSEVTRSFHPTASGLQNGRSALSNSPRAGLSGSQRAAGWFQQSFRAEFRPNNVHTNLTWRQVGTIADDPDQPWNPRLQVLGQLGLGWAAAVPFSMHGQEGIVVYMARDGVDLEQLQSPSNERYLMAASEFAGAAYALKSPRQIAVKERIGERALAWRRFRNRLLVLIREGKDLEQVVADNTTLVKQQDDEWSISMATDRSVVFNWLESMRRVVVACLQKSRGGGSQPPPSFTVRQTLLTFIGVLVTFLCLARLNAFLHETAGKDFAMNLGPFGALMTLQYGLTAAPAAQPRNAILGQVVSIAIAMAISYLDMSLWLKQSLATALAIAIMVRYGITHPPAGAAAVIFASGQFKWSNVVMVLVGNLIAIITATLINNLSKKRQYPMYWGVGWLDAWSQPAPTNLLNLNEKKL